MSVLTKISPKRLKRPMSSIMRYEPPPAAPSQATASASYPGAQVSTKFILSTLGPCAKYSSCLYPTGKETLEEAEILMLESYCDKARLTDGLDILDLGCGMWDFTYRPSGTDIIFV
jgi:cyclopropane fatty-acyl-phospholipid synthase-like methyltransferase